jgi:organic radical activating enzyme
MSKPFCVAPFVETFNGYDSTFRNCCAANPQIKSLPGQTFQQWQQDPRLQDFRQRMWSNTWLPECHRCQLKEQESGHSFRTALNSDPYASAKNFGVWPSRWNLKFGNICNLACWSCNELASSVIQQQKRRLNLLPADFQDPEQEFQTVWPDLQSQVLRSYDYHDVVTITLLGGEPMYNRTVLSFLQHLIDAGLAKRTRLEFHTNGTVANDRLFAQDTWHHVCVFLSLDAVGRKAEWLRSGCHWLDIEKNIEFFKARCNHVEVHCTLGVLNLGDLPELHKFCKQQELSLGIYVLTEPECMSLLKWPGDPADIADRQKLVDCDLDFYYNQVGVNADQSMPDQLALYIEQWQPFRGNLGEVDEKLYRAIQQPKLMIVKSK